MKKKFSLSQIALLIILILSAVVLVMFYGVGYGTQETINDAVYTAPANTGLLLYWLYALVALCVAVVFIFGIAKLFRKKSSKSGKNSLVGFVFLFTLAAVVVSYFLSSSEAIRLGDHSLFEDQSMLKLTDTCLYTMYALAAVAILTAILAMIGVFKARVKK
ncbi:MAG: hypothetical protein J5732_02090 [Bacteroidaceae bacterium]|nr:hypothetical protein [Bacteroidaceae bacterium]